MSTGGRTEPSKDRESLPDGVDVLLRLEKLALAQVLFAEPVKLIEQLGQGFRELGLSVEVEGGEGIGVLVHASYYGADVIDVK